mmetsp:Transcript_31692/g.100665  ORF Transcript_31692/g.100665 Transcript_31692/m.100665 type:complete len:277 (-) Transcript_31692:467-1297(-)
MSVPPRSASQMPVPQKSMTSRIQQSTMRRNGSVCAVSTRLPMRTMPKRLRSLPPPPLPTPSAPSAPSPSAAAPSPSPSPSSPSSSDSGASSGTTSSAAADAFASSRKSSDRTSKSSRPVRTLRPLPLAPFLSSFSTFSSAWALAAAARSAFHLAKVSAVTGVPVSPRMCSSSRIASMRSTTVMPAYGSTALAASSSCFFFASSTAFASARCLALRLRRPLPLGAPITPPSSDVAKISRSSFSSACLARRAALRSACFSSSVLKPRCLPELWTCFFT